MKISCTPYELRLKEPFTISRGTVTNQQTLIVQVDYEGMTGLGEATTNPYYGVTLEQMQGALAEVQPALENRTLDNPAEIWKELDPILQSSRFAQCALDCALWDLYAQLHNMPLWQLWGLHADDPYPPSCFTIGIDEPDVMARKMSGMPNWPVYKIKLGEDGGLHLVRTLRKSTDALFRVDANCSWKPDQVLEFAAPLSELGVELIEQPLAADQWDAMQQLKGKSPLPLMADESCQTEADVDRCIETFDAINIKLVKCGGLTPARRMLTRARQNGLKVMVGCMTESSVGIAAGVHLLPLLDFADLDGALLLANDIAEGLSWREGICELPKVPGLGVQLKKPS